MREPKNGFVSSSYRLYCAESGAFTGPLSVGVQCMARVGGGASTHLGKTSSCKICSRRIRWLGMRRRLKLKGKLRNRLLKNTRSKSKPEPGKKTLSLSPLINEAWLIVRCIRGCKARRSRLTGGSEEHCLVCCGGPLGVRWFGNRGIRSVPDPLGASPHCRCVQCCKMGKILNRIARFV